MAVEPDLESNITRGTKSVGNKKPADDSKPFVGPEECAEHDIGEPGEFPYTRGIHHTMYTERLWTMRQFAGFGSAENTNQRFKFLLEKGQTGLSTAFDLPTLMGRDADDPLALGEAGKCGVSIGCLEDMHRLFDGINLGQVSTSMTINAPAAILLAFYICVAEDQGVPLAELRGTLQNDILKEFHAQNEYVFPPRESVNLVIDTIEYCTAHMPQWNTVSISGYHIREAGATAPQELAFTLADGMCYVDKCLERGMNVDSFAPLALAEHGHVAVLVRPQVRPGPIHAEEPGMQMERVDRVELGDVDQVHAHQITDPHRDRVHLVVECHRVDRVHLVIAVKVRIEAVHHHHHLVEGMIRRQRLVGIGVDLGPPARWVDDERAVQALVDVALQRQGMAVVQVQADGIGFEFVDL